MILVTGGAGFIGSVLLERLLKDNYKVRVLDNLMYGGEPLVPFASSPILDVHIGDVRIAETCIDALKNVDICIHLAAIVGENACNNNQRLAAETNYYATRQLWEIARDCGVKTFIFASTCSNYGVAQLANEDSELKPLGLYASTKVDAENWLLSQDSEMTTVVLRFATAFGISPRQRWDLLINEFVLDAYLNHSLSIYNANAQRPYAHVKDIALMVSEIVRLVTTFKGFNKEVFNVGGFNRSKLDIANIIQRSIHCLRVDMVQKGDDRDYKVDFSKIHSYGIMPFRPPETEIERIIRALPLFDDLKASKWRNA